MRDLPSTDAQKAVIAEFMIKHAANRRSPAEAAAEAATMSDAKRRRLFRALRSLKCIEHTDRGWVAVRPMPTAEQIAMDDEIGQD